MDNETAHGRRRGIGFRGVAGGFTSSRARHLSVVTPHGIAPKRVSGQSRAVEDHLWMFSGFWTSFEKG